MTTLRNAIRHQSLTHAYLFSGPRGTGKTTLARIVAKSLNCSELQEGVEPCNQCPNCEAIANGRLVDLIEIDAASNRGIDEIRELREKILFAPNQGKAKVYIIDEVHMLTKEAFNALLKTLEEPPSHAYFILATTEVHKIPDTILSRCQQFNVKRISKDDIIKRLEHIAEQEKVQAEPDALELIAKISGGGLRDAIGLFEQMTIDRSVIYQEVVDYLGITGHMMIEEFFQCLLNKNAARAVEMISQINGQGQDLNQFCRELIAYLREQMLLGLNDREKVAEVILYIEIFSGAKQQINQALIPQLPLEVAVMKACGFESKAKEVSTEKSTSDDTAATKDGTVETRGASHEVPDKGVPQEKDEVKKETEPPEDLTLESVKENWQRVAENIDTPFIRMSFMDSDPVKMEKGNLYLCFRSNTMMEKVAKPTNQNEILQAFKKVLGTKVTLKLELKKVDLKPVKEEKKDPESNLPVIQMNSSKPGQAGIKPADSDPSVIEMAKEVFGQ